MGPVGVPGELNLAAGLEQRDVHLLSLADGAPLVGLAVDDERRRLRAVGERRRRTGLVPFARRPRRPAPLDLAEMVADVARAVHRLKVETRGATDGCGEAVALADGPGSHVPAVAVAPDAGTSRVGVRPLQHMIQHGHEVEVIFAAPIAKHPQGELAAVRRRAARVREDDEEAVGGQELLPGVEGPAVVAVGPAVDVEHNRIPQGGVEIGREEQPSLDGQASPLHDEPLPASGRRLAQEGRVEVGQEALFAGLPVAEEHIARAVERREALRDPPS